MRRPVPLKKSWSSWHGPLDDASKMPFGIHIGTVMAEVPDSYLLGLYEKLKKDNSIYPDSMGDRVREYVGKNLDVIQKNAANESTHRKG